LSVRRDGSNVHRRTYLAAVGTAASAALAGCGASDDSTDTPPATGTGRPTDTATQQPTDTATQQPTETTPDGTPDPGAQPPDDTPTTLQNDSFEDGLADWTVGRDLPDDPGNPGQPVDASVSATSEHANSGSSGVEMTLDGSADDGTIWVQQAVDFADADRLEVHCYSPEATFNKLAELAVYTGPEPEGGLVEVDFDRSEQTGDHQGWKRYEYPIETSETGIVAVGMNIVWETTVTRWFDDIRLQSD